MSTPRPWLPMPSPIRRLFTAFPLITFPSSPLPSSCPSPVNVPRLYIYSTSSDQTFPSWDAESLKWQVSSKGKKIFTNCRHFSAWNGKNALLYQAQGILVLPVNYHFLCCQLSFLKLFHYINFSSQLHLNSAFLSIREL